MAATAAIAKKCCCLYVGQKGTDDHCSNYLFGIMFLFLPLAYT